MQDESRSSPGLMLWGVFLLLCALLINSLFDSSVAKFIGLGFAFGGLALAVAYAVGTAKELRANKH